MNEVRTMSKEELEAQRQRKREIEAQRLADPKFQTRPLGKAPAVTLEPLEPFNREEVVEKAKKHRVDIYTRPSHRRPTYE